MITVLAGGIGAAKFLSGLIEEVEPSEVTAIVNVADDANIHGLHVSPDLDSCTYTLAGANDTERGWGLRHETWAALEQLRRYAEAGGVTSGDASGWFSLGDRDLGTHLFRTSRLIEGVPLSVVSAEIARGWGLATRLLPVTDDPVRTRVRCADGRDLAFQEYFVRERHDVEVASVHLQGIEAARPAPGVLEAISEAEVVVVAPSNPVVSIDPVLAVEGVRQAVQRRRDRVVAISPIVGGAALKGPADRLMRDLGHEPTVVGIARWYSSLASCLVIDLEDAAEAAAVQDQGLECIVTDTIMRSTTVSAALARTALDAVAPPTDR